VGRKTDVRRKVKNWSTGLASQRKLQKGKALRGKVGMYVLGSEGNEKNPRWDRAKLK